MKKSRLPRYRRVSDPPGMVLTPRDQEILRQVYAYRMLTREQIERLLFAPERGQDHFTKTSKARERLKFLFHHGYLDRIPLPVGASSWAWRPVYRLARKGAEHIAAEQGIPVQQVAYWGKGDDRTRRHTQVSLLFMEHALQINDVRVAFAIAAKKEGYHIDKWFDDTTLKSQAQKDYVAVPQGMGTRQYAVIPDSFFVLNLGSRAAAFFLELDRATMPQPRWTARVLAYLTYFRSGKYTARYQMKSLRILTVTTTEARLSNLQKSTRNAGGSALFWFTTLEELTASSVFFSPIWRLANDEPEGARKTLLG